MPQLNPEFFLSQVFWLALIFGCIYFFVSRFFFPKIGQVVELRKAQINDDIKFSEIIVENYKRIELEAVQIIDDAKGKAFTIIESATKNAEQQVAERVSNAEKDISQRAAKAEERLVRLKIKLHQDLDLIALDLKTEILSKLHSNLQIHDSKDK